MRTHTKINLPQDQDTDLKLRTKSSRQGASTGAGNNFVSSFFGEVFLKIDEKYHTFFVPRAVGCASSKILMRRSQVLLKCLGLAANYFFTKSSCCVFAQKIDPARKNCVD